jgi:hypothetical protein
MLISEPPKSGIFFAIWPRRVPEGLVAFEWLHWEWVEARDAKSYGHFRYARWVPPDRYDAGERRNFNPHPGAQAEFFKTPPFEPFHRPGP